MYIKIINIEFILENFHESSLWSYLQSVASNRCDDGIAEGVFRTDDAKYGFILLKIFQRPQNLRREVFFYFIRSIK